MSIFRHGIAHAAATQPCCSAVTLHKSSPAQTQCHHALANMRPANPLLAPSPQRTPKGVATRTCSHASRKSSAPTTTKRGSTANDKRRPQQTRTPKQQADDQSFAATRQQLAKTAAKQARKLDPKQRAATLQGKAAIPERFAAAAARMLVIAIQQ